MKIGIVCPYDIDRGGGVQEQVLAQAAELQKRGHKVAILTPKPRKQENPNTGDIKVIYVGSSANVRTPIKTSLELGFSYKKDELDDILAEEKFDLLHIHEPEVPMLGAQIVAKATCPVIATFHAVYPETPMGRSIETFRIPWSKSIFSRLTTLTAVSDAAATFVKERTGREVHIIPNGIDLTKYTYQPKVRPPAKKTILYVGRLEKRKGVVYLLKAYKAMAGAHPDVSLVLAGNGDQRIGLEAYVEDKKIPRVSFLGFVSEKEKLDLLHKATVFCSPALYGESFGIVLLEAMASGTVTVAGSNIGYAGVLSGGGQTALVNPKKIGEFTHKLQTMLSDTDERQKWLDWAKAEVQQYDYPEVVDKYEVVYKATLKVK